MSTKRSPAITDLLNRRVALARVAEFSRRGHVRHRAYKMLIRGPRPHELVLTLLNVNRIDEVESLLNYIRQKDPRLFVALPSKKVAAWTLFLESAPAPRPVTFLIGVFFALLALIYISRLH